MDEGFGGGFADGGEGLYGLRSELAVAEAGGEDVNGGGFLSSGLVGEGGAEAEDEESDAVGAHGRSLLDVY